MASATLSRKYQIVIPKKVRQDLGLAAGSKIIFYSIDNQRAVLTKQPKDPVKDLQGLGKEIWRELGGADKYIQQERASWENR